MTDFKENHIKVGGLISDGISPNKRKVKIKLALKDGTEGLVLTPTNIFYFSHSPSNLVSLGLLNDIGIFYYNKDQTLYNQEIRKVFVFAEYYNTSFLLYLFNLLIVAVSLLKHNDIYKSKKLNI